MRYMKSVARALSSTNCRLNHVIYELSRKYPDATRLLSSVSPAIHSKLRANTSDSDCQVYNKMYTRNATYSTRRHSVPSLYSKPAPRAVRTSTSACVNVQVYSKVYTLGRPLPITRSLSPLQRTMLNPKMSFSTTRLPSDVTQSMRDLKTALVGIRISRSAAGHLDTKEYEHTTSPTSRLAPSVLLRNRSSPRVNRSSASVMYAPTSSYPSPRPAVRTVRTSLLNTDVYETGTSYVTTRRQLSKISPASISPTESCQTYNRMYKPITSATRVPFSVSKTKRTLNLALHDIRTITDRKYTTMYEPGTTYPTATRLPSSVPPTIRNPKPAAPLAIRTSTSASGSVAPPASTYTMTDVQRVRNLNNDLKKLRTQTMALLHDLDVPAQGPIWCSKYSS